MNDLNVGDKVIYKDTNAVIVDHYGAGVYAIEIDGEWKSVHRKELTIENEVI
jgi:hypothetical protein